MNTERLRFNAYGKLIDVECGHGRWIACYKGDDGKRRKADDIVIPDSMDRSELQQYIADLLHEWANAKHPDVEALEH